MIGVSSPAGRRERWLARRKYPDEDLAAAGYQVDLQYADSKPEMQVQQIEKHDIEGIRVVLIVGLVDNSAPFLRVGYGQGKRNRGHQLRFRGIVGSSDIDYFVDGQLESGNHAGRSHH